MNYAHEIKQAVSMIDACERYGITLNRAGFGRCPFHNERTASFKAYSGNRGYCCFGCHAVGDIIDFVMRFFDISFKDALSKLNRDFGLNYPLGAPPDAETRKEIARRKQISDASKRFEAWRVDMIRMLSDCFYLAFSALKWCAPDYWTAEMRDAVKNQSTIEYYLVILSGRDIKQQMQIFRDREGVKTLCKMILNNLQMK